jgi:hypothetical protein
MQVPEHLTHIFNSCIIVQGQAEQMLYGTCTLTRVPRNKFHWRLGKLNPPIGPHRHQRARKNVEQVLINFSRHFR